MGTIHYLKPIAYYRDLAIKIAPAIIAIFISICITFPKFGLITLTFAIFAVLVYRFATRFEHFILYIAVYTPFEEFILKWFPVYITRYARFIPEVFLFTIFLICLLHRWRKKGISWPRNPLNYPLLVFLLAIFLSAISNQVPTVIVLASIKNLMRYVTLYYLISFLFIRPVFIYRITEIMMIVAFIQALLGIVETIFGPQVGYFLRSDVTGFSVLTGIQNVIAAFAKAKPSGTIGIFSAFGAFLAFWAIMTFARFLKTRKKIYLGLYGLLAIGTIISRSRTSWIFLLLGTIAIIYFYRRDLLTRSIFLLTPAISGIIIFITVEIINPFGSQEIPMTNWHTLIVSSGPSDMKVRPETVLRRFSELFSADYWRTSSRLAIFSVTLPEILKKYPLLGLGPGTIGSEVTGGGSTSPGYFPEHSHEHWLNVPFDLIIWTADSGWIALLAQFGLLGLLPWWVFFYRIFRRSVNIYLKQADSCANWIALGMLGNTISMFICTFSVHYLTYRAISLYFWIWAAFLMKMQCSQDGRFIRTRSKIL